MSDEEKWVKAYEKLKKEGMLAPAVDYEELFAKSEFQGKKLFLFSMGTVTFPTGKIIVCDPLVYLDKNTVPYREKVPVGTFMLETLAAEMEEGNFRYIATRIRFAEEEAAYYELALTGTEIYMMISLQIYLQRAMKQRPGSREKGATGSISRYRGLHTGFP